MSKRSTIDFYVVLGIEPSATTNEIAAAYRSLARKHHPDSAMADCDSSNLFKAVAEAYQTLSDPKRRCEYDRQLSWNVHSEVRSTDLDMASRAACSTQVMEVPVTPEEARAGAQVALTLTQSRQCDACGGDGCAACDGRGSTRQRRPLQLQLPPGAADGTLLRLPREKVVLCIRIRPYW